MKNETKSFRVVASATAPNQRVHLETARFIKKLHHEEKKGGRVVSVDVKIYENPTIMEIRALVGDKKGACLRALVTAQHIWAWPAYDATHEQMRTILIVEGLAEEGELTGAYSAVLSAEAKKGIEIRFYPKDIDAATKLPSVVALYNRDAENNLIMEM